MGSSSFDLIAMRGRLDKSIEMDKQRGQNDSNETVIEPEKSSSTDVSKSGLKVVKLSRSGKRIVKIGLNLEVNMADALHDLATKFRYKEPLGEYNTTTMVEMAVALLLVSQGESIDDIDINPRNKKLLEGLISELKQ